MKEKWKNIPWLKIHHWADTNEWSATLGAAPLSSMNESNLGFTAPPWTQRTHRSVDDITFLDFLPYYILKTMFIYCIHYETSDILIWVASNTNRAKTLMFPSMCIKQSCVCTTASRIVHEHARTNTQLLSWFGVMVRTFFILLVLELNKPAFWRTWIFKTEKIKHLL